MKVLGEVSNQLKLYLLAQELDDVADEKIRRRSRQIILEHNYEEALLFFASTPRVSRFRWAAGRGLLPNMA